MQQNNQHTTTTKDRRRRKEIDPVVVVVGNTKTGSTYNHVVHTASGVWSSVQRAGTIS